jgi:ATP-binding cassette subfamily B protein/subfamily B ATP-binding cassette protein MsbA
MNRRSGEPSGAFSLWDLRRYLKPHALAVVIAGLSMSGRSALLLLAPWPLKFIVDNVIFQKPLSHWLSGFLPDPIVHRLQLLDVLALVLLAMGVADAALGYCGNRFLLRAGQRAIFAVRRDLFAHMQRLSLTFHHRQRTGELMARLGGDVQTLQDFVVTSGTSIFAHALTVVGMAAIMLSIDWRFALVAIGATPVLLWIARHYSTLLRQAFRRARRKEGELWGKVQEIIANVQVVQAYGREPHEDRRFGEQATQSLVATLEASARQIQLEPLVGLVMGVATAAVAWYGATRVLSGRISAGELLVYLAYLRAMAAPVRQFARAAGVYGKASVAAERLGDVFLEVSEIHDRWPRRNLSSCSGELEFRSVSFAYVADVPVLRDVSFHVRPGQTVALVGATGAGKSTLVSLVPRFHDPANGQVLMDGHDLRDVSLASIRSQVALVLQQALVFHGTLWENIAYGRAGANRTDAIAAARAAGIDDLIEAMPTGYDTLVGERGATLSGGQRQCISIARAMLRNAPIVILDEPTNSIDPDAERRIMEALRRLTSGRTTLIIAHRLATVVGADLILVLHGGALIESGTHQQLLARGGRYFDLWSCSSGATPALFVGTTTRGSDGSHPQRTAVSDDRRAQLLAPTDPPPSPV